MNNQDEIFNSVQVAQIKKAHTNIRKELELDTYDHDHDQINFLKVLKNVALKESNGSLIRKSKEKNLSMNDRTSAIARPITWVSIGGMILTFILGYGVNYFVNIKHTSLDTQSVLLRSQSSIDPTNKAENHNKIINEKTIKQILSDAKAVEVKTKDPILLRSKLIESAFRAGLEIYIVTENERPVFLVTGLDSSKADQISFRALAGISNRQDGAVKIQFKD